VSVLAYGVCKAEVEEFSQIPEVNGFLRRYREGVDCGRGSRWEKAYSLARFFKWLHVVKGVDVSPKQFLNEQLRLRASQDIADRSRHLSWVLEFTRDNPDFKDKSDTRKYSYFSAVKLWCDFHEVPLTSAKNVFGKRKKRKNHRKQISIVDAKKILGLVGQRERTILLCMLQSGMEISAVLYKFGGMAEYIYRKIEAGAERIRIDFFDRKGNNTEYFTFISRDGIQELKKWFAVRLQILGKQDLDKPIFVSNTGADFSVNHFEQNFTYVRRKHKFNASSHDFRRLFKTEASPPERGVDRAVVEFMMGHVSGVEVVGGVYDRTPELYADVIEREYAKLEPYVNVYSGVVADEGLVRVSKDTMARLELLLKWFDEGKVKIME